MNRLVNLGAELVEVHSDRGPKTYVQHGAEALREQSGPVSDTSPKLQPSPGLRQGIGIGDAITARKADAVAAASGGPEVFASGS